MDSNLERYRNLVKHSIQDGEYLEGLLHMDPFQVLSITISSIIYRPNVTQLLKSPSSFVPEKLQVRISGLRAVTR